MRKKLWDGWVLTEKIGEGNFGEVYRAIKEVDGVNLTCAVKYVSLPKNQEQLNQLVKNGIVKNVQEANNYYLNIINDLKKEINIMQRFKSNPNIINFYDYIQESKYDGTGVDFYIRMEFAEDIDSYFSSRKPTVNDVVQLGIDICRALEVCQSLNIIHKDIKPANIFIGSDGKYKLSDFGIASTIEADGGNFIGTYNYMSPEVYNKDKVTYSTDIYSLGIVMYKLLNNNKLPFYTKLSSDKDILNARMSGINVFPIKGVKKELMDIIIKACSYNVNDRYRSAKQLREALEKISDVVVPKVELSATEKTISIYEAETLNSSQFSDKKAFGKKSINSFMSFKELLNNKGNTNEKNRKLLKDKLVKRLILILIILVIVICLLRACTSSKKCDNGYVNNNGLCVKGYYYCDEGYALNKDNKCQKVIESVSARLNMYCDDGYILNGDKCVFNDTKEPRQGYQCGPGFTLKGNKCIGEDLAAPNVNYNCPSGYTIVGDTCVKVTNMEASVSYKCPNNNYVLSGSSCSYTESNSSYLISNTTCPNGKTYNSNLKKCCYGAAWYGCTEPTVTKSCSKGTYNGSTCIVKNTVAATAKYSCPSGYDVIANQCVKTEKKNPSVNLSCSNGYKLKDNKCYGSISVDAIQGYVCDDGYIFTGQACVTNKEVNATKEYSCSKKYTLNGEKCEKYKIKDSKIHVTE